MKTIVSLCVIHLALVAPAFAQTIVTFSRTPVAIRVGSTQPISIVAQTSGTLTGLRLDLAAGGSVNLTSTGANRWEGSVTAAQALFDYQADDANHNLIGFLRLLGTGGVLKTYNIFINVLDQNVPSVPIQDLPNEGRRTERILNLRRPSLTLSPESSPGPRLEDVKRAAKEAYANLPDIFDFLQIAWTLPSYFQNRGHFVARNNVSGIGTTIRDESSQYGSAGKLLGVTLFPLDSMFDFAESAFSHETSHQWIMYLQHPLLKGSIPHWPPSTMGRGVMGITLPGGVGGSFAWIITPLTATTVRTDLGAETKEFDDFDLYLMGLLPPEQVAPGWVIQGTACDGCTLPATKLTITDVTNVEGPRIPNSSQSRKAFRLGTVIITSDRLLTDDEMAMCEYWAVRGEAKTDLPYSSGLVKGTTKPFFRATRGLATVDFRLVDKPARRRSVRR